MRLWLLVYVSLLTGCSLMGGPVHTSPMASYTITRWAPSNEQIEVASSSSRDILLATTPVAAPGFDSAAMIYVNIPYQLKSYSLNQWVSPPANLLLPLFADSLRATHAFKAVVTTPFSGIATFQLNTQLLVLEQEFIHPISCVRLRVIATLLRVSTGEVVANRVFEAVIPAPGNNPYSGVLATNTAANQVAGELAAFVKQQR